MISIIGCHDNADEKTQQIKTIKLKIKFVKEKGNGHINPPDLIAKTMDGLDRIFKNEDGRLSEEQLKMLEAFRKDCSLKTESDQKYKEILYITFKLKDTNITPIGIGTFREAFQECLNK